MKKYALLTFVLFGILNAVALAQTWSVGDPVLLPGPKETFSETSAKDPTLVQYAGKWHVFFTAAGKGEYTTGYVAASDLTKLQDAPRFELEQARGKGKYGCAPQVFYFSSQKKWYLLFQTRDSNYQPTFCTTDTIEKPESWSQPQHLLKKDSRSKWIDFWVICDATTCYLFYTESHRQVMVRSTSVKNFPHGWGPAQKVFGGVHEAVHIYKVKDKEEYHLIYEINKNNIRSFGLAKAKKLTGPWERVTDTYATGDQLKFVGKKAVWTEMVSHGEALRSGYDEKMEYEPEKSRWLIQGLKKNETNVSYPKLPWKLGVISKQTIE